MTKLKCAENVGESQVKMCPAVRCENSAEALKRKTYSSSAIRKKGSVIVNYSDLAAIALTKIKDRGNAPKTSGTASKGSKLITDNCALPSLIKGNNNKVEEPLGKRICEKSNSLTNISCSGLKLALKTGAVAPTTVMCSNVHHKMRVNFERHPLSFALSPQKAVIPNTVHPCLGNIKCKVSEAKPKNNTAEVRPKYVTRAFTSTDDVQPVTNHCLREHSHFSEASKSEHTETNLICSLQPNRCYPNLKACALRYRPTIFGTFVHKMFPNMTASQKRGPYQLILSFQAKNKVEPEHENSIGKDHYGEYYLENTNELKSTENIRISEAPQSDCRLLGQNITHETQIKSPPFKIESFFKNENENECSSLATKLKAGHGYKAENPFKEDFTEAQSKCWQFNGEDELNFGRILMHKIDLKNKTAVCVSLPLKYEQAKALSKSGLKYVLNNSIRVLYPFLLSSSTTEAIAETKNCEVIASKVRSKSKDCWWQKKIESFNVNMNENKGEHNFYNKFEITSPIIPVFPELDDKLFKNSNSNNPFDKRVNLLSKNTKKLIIGQPIHQKIILSPINDWYTSTAKSKPLKMFSLVSINELKPHQLGKIESTSGSTVRGEVVKLSFQNQTSSNLESYNSYLLKKMSPILYEILFYPECKKEKSGNKLENMFFPSTSNELKLSILTSSKGFNNKSNLNSKTNEGNLSWPELKQKYIKTVINLKAPLNEAFEDTNFKINETQKSNIETFDEFIIKPDTKNSVQTERKTIVLLSEHSPFPGLSKYEELTQTLITSKPQQLNIKYSIPETWLVTEISNPSFSTQKSENSNHGSFEPEIEKQGTKELIGLSTNRLKIIEDVGDVMQYNTFDLKDSSTTQSTLNDTLNVKDQREGLIIPKEWTTESVSTFDNFVMTDKSTILEDRLRETSSASDNYPTSAEETTAHADSCFFLEMTQIPEKVSNIINTPENLIKSYGSQQYDFDSFYVSSTRKTLETKLQPSDFIQITTRNSFEHVGLPPCLEEFKSCEIHEEILTTEGTSTILIDNQPKSAQYEKSNLSTESMKEINFDNFEILGKLEGQEDTSRTSSPVYSTCATEETLTGTKNAILLGATQMTGEVSNDSEISHNVNESCTQRLDLDSFYSSLYSGRTNETQYFPQVNLPILNFESNTLAIGIPACLDEFKTFASSETSLPAILVQENTNKVQELYSGVKKSMSGNNNEIYQSLSPFTISVVNDSCSAAPAKSPLSLDAEVSPNSSTGMNKSDSSSYSIDILDGFRKTIPKEWMAEKADDLPLFYEKFWRFFPQEVTSKDICEQEEFVGHCKGKGGNNNDPEKVELSKYECLPHISYETKGSQVLRAKGSPTEYQYDIEKKETENQNSLAHYLDLFQLQKPVGNEINTQKGSFIESASFSCDKVVEINQIEIPVSKNNSKGNFRQQENNGRYTERIKGNDKGRRFQDSLSKKIVKKPILGTKKYYRSTLRSIMDWIRSNEDVAKIPKYVRTEKHPWKMERSIYKTLQKTGSKIFPIADIAEVVNRTNHIIGGKTSAPKGELKGKIKTAKDLKNLHDSDSTETLKVEEPSLSPILKWMRSSQDISAFRFKKRKKSRILH